ncbi:MAG: DUF4230 domain-containing protein [Bacteroidota bacterium]|nr:DUF4230 domain-containing protein [Bacteroidota bacterium]
MMKKRLKQISIFLVLAIIIIWIIAKVQSLPSFKNLFKPKAVTIANTPVAVKQIQALAQLVTMSMYEEIVVDSNINNDVKLNLPLLPDVILSGTEKTLVIIGKTTTHVGIDMQELDSGNISGTPDSIHIVLPPAKVLDAIINPSDVTIFIEKGDWNNEAVFRLKNKIQYIAITDAQSRGLLALSERKATEIFTQFFSAAGYKKVVIQFREAKMLQNKS